MWLDGGKARLIILHVEGMTCGSCEGTVRASIEQQLGDNLLGVLVSKEEGSARVLCKAEVDVSSCTIRSCVEAVGFDVWVASDSTVERTAAPMREQLLAVPLSSSSESNRSLTESMSSGSSSQSKYAESIYQATFLLKDTVEAPDLSAIESVAEDLAGVISARSSSATSCISIDYVRSTLLDGPMLLKVLNGVGVTVDLLDDRPHRCINCSCVHCTCCRQAPAAPVTTERGYGKKLVAGGAAKREAAATTATLNPLLTSATVTTATIAITGMTCSSCSGIVERTLLALGAEGVVSAEVNLSTNTAKVIFRPSESLSAQSLSNRIEGVGYGAVVLGEQSGDLALEVVDRAMHILLVAQTYVSSAADGDEDRRLLRKEFARVFSNGSVPGVGSVVDLTPEAHQRLSDRLVAEVIAMWTRWRCPQSEEPLDFQLKIEFDEQTTGPRDLLRVARQHGFVCSVKNCGGFMTAARLYQQQSFESSKMLLLLALGLSFTIPIIVLTMILPLYPEANAKAREPYRDYPGINPYGTSILLLSSPVFFVIGSVFHHKAAVTLLRSGAAGMDFLISSGSSAAYLYSFISYCRGAVQGSPLDGDVEFFETSAVLITVVIIGKCLEMYARAQTAKAIFKLSNLRASTARLVTAKGSAYDGSAADSCANPDPIREDAAQRLRPLQLSQSEDADVEMSSNGSFAELAGHKEEIDAALLHVGDVVRLVVGESVPADGVFMSDSVGMDESMMTGESAVVNKEPGAAVFAGTIVVQGGGLMRVTACGDRSTLGKIIAMVQDAQMSKPPIQELADAVARYFVPVVVIASLVTFLCWEIAALSDSIPKAAMGKSTSKFAFAFFFALAVWVSACPCSFGLATPTAILVATGVAAKLGILIRRGAALQLVSEVDVVAFDKTGTLTMGSTEVTDVIFFKDDGRIPYSIQKGCLINDADRTAIELLFLAESRSDHPIARGVAKHCSSLLRGDTAASQAPLLLPHVRVTSFEAVQSRGLHIVASSSSSSSSTSLLVGSMSLLKDFGIELSEHESDLANATAVRLRVQGRVVVFFAVDSRIRGVVALVDSVRPEASAVISELSHRHIECFMVTGDDIVTARAVAARVGIKESNILAGASPYNKEAFVQETQLGGGKVAFIGDGTNDGPALATAHVGLAMAGGTAIALDSGDVVLCKNNLHALVVFLDLSRKTMRQIVFNYFWALIYNLILIPIAAGVLVPISGYMLDPMLAGMAMAASSVCIVLSSLTLLLYRPPPQRQEQPRALPGEEKRSLLDDTDVVSL